MRKNELDMEFEAYLWIWAAWIIGIHLGEMGWPKENPLSKFAKVGFTPPCSNPASKPLIFNPRAEMVNRYINVLIRIHPEWADAVYAHYTSDRSKNQKAMAKERNISPRTFRDRLKRGRDWLHASIQLEFREEKVVKPADKSNIIYLNACT
jgi:hypothetical protein